MRKKYALLFNRFRIILVILVLPFVYSCKKDNQVSNEESLENAKSWYMKTHENDVSKIRSTKDIINKIKQEPLWKDAKLVITESGVLLVSIRLETTLGDKPFGKGSFLLLISKNGNAYDSRTIFSENADEFTNNKMTSDVIEELNKLAFIPSNTTHLYNMSNSVSPKRNTSFQASINPLKDRGIMNLQEAGCTNYYLVTTYYDGDGNYLYEEEQWLYSYGCDEGSGGTGGGGGSHEEQIEWGEPIDENHTIAIVGEDSGSKTADLSWLFHRSQNSFKFKSVERALVSWDIATQSWKFVNFNHLSTSGIGNTTTGFPELDLVNNTITGTDISKSIKLDYKEGRRIPTTGGWSTVWYQGTFSASSSWTAQNIGEN